jgi:hypothetical protein
MTSETFLAEVSQPAASDSAAIASAAAVLCGESVSIELQSGKEISGELKYIGFDSTTLVSPTHGIPMMLATADIRRIVYRDRGSGALIGAASLGILYSGCALLAAGAYSSGIENLSSEVVVICIGGGLLVGGLVGAGTGALLPPTTSLEFPEKPGMPSVANHVEPAKLSDSLWIQIPQQHVETDSTFIFIWSGLQRTISKGRSNIERTPEWIRVKVARTWLEETN